MTNSSTLFDLDSLRRESASDLKQRKLRIAQRAQGEVLPSQSLHHRHREFLSSGWGPLDRLLKVGIPRGKIIELEGRLSSGKTGLAFSLMAEATLQEELVAWVDAFDTLDPASAERAGVDLKRLLWVRCRNFEDALERSFKALDVLIQAGGFGVVVFDLDPVSSRGDEKVKRPLHDWFRLQRAVRGTRTILLILSRRRVAGSAASVAFSLDRTRVDWTPRIPSARAFSTHGAGDCRMVNQLRGVESVAQLVRGETHGSIPLHCSF